MPIDIVFGCNLPLMSEHSHKAANDNVYREKMYMYASIVEGYTVLPTLVSAAGTAPARCPRNALARFRLLA